ncbi:MAG: site-2 protease family protein [Leptospirales bacterium]
MQLSPRRWIPPLLLYLATFLTTTGAGAILAGKNPFTSSGDLAAGLPFSLSLMLILTLHESGHVVAALRHGLPVSLPYFIPAPTLIGTFGAIIRMPPVVHTKSALFDIGISGPIAGLIPSLIAVTWGIQRSSPIHTSEVAGHGLELGNSILFRTLSTWTGPMVGDHSTLVLSAVGFAGWMGLLITGLNLIPAGQLDGGHFFYALWGPKVHRKIWMVTLIILSWLGMFDWKGWWIWMGFIALMGPRHPEVSDPETPLSGWRKAFGYSMILVELLIFVPVPFVNI